MSEPEKKVELVQGTVYQLDPEKRYIIAFDNRAIPKGEVTALQDALKVIGLKHSVGVIVNGNPNSAIKVIET